MRRTGIDLSSIRCNVVDAESSGRRRKGGQAMLRVHQFASITHLDNAQALTAELKALSASFSRRAWVNLWDVRSSHQYLLLPSAPDSELESRARRHGASVLGMPDLDVTVATSIGGTRGEPGHHPKREVSFFAAGSDEIRARLRPIVEAGFLVEGVTTPCGALWSQARLRRASLPGEVHAHVALGVSQSALGIFSDGALLYARDLDWGYAAQSMGTPVAHDRELLADRLSAELRRSFLYLKQYWEQDVAQVLLCGDMPEIRSLTAPLIERLNIEVETLDTLDGIDTETLPEGFAERAPMLRLGFVDCGRTASRQSAACRSDGEPDEQDRTAHRRCGHRGCRCDWRISVRAGERDAARRRSADRRRASRDVVAAGAGRGRQHNRRGRRE